jgi:glutathione peroxidase
MNAHDFILKGIDGQDIHLSDFKGKKILLVNTASACGLTPQYAQLQELHEQFQEKVQIIGLPCNDFAGQEPGTEEDIQSFCSLKYKITFPMTSKITIKGENMHPLYQWLTKKSENNFSDSEVKWNFQKYLIDENGHLIAVFAPTLEVFNEEVLSAIGISL